MQDKILKNKVINNTFYLVVGQILGLLFNMATIVLIARYFDKELFGIFSYGLVVVGFLSLIPDFGMKPILIRELSNINKHNKIVSNVFVIKLFMVLSIIIILIILLSVHSNIDLKVKLTILILSTSMLFASKSNTLRMVLESSYNSRLNSKFVVVSQLLDSLFQFIVIVILIKLKLSYIAILIGYTLSTIPGFIWIVYRYIKDNHLNNININIKDHLWIFNESYPLFLYLIVVMLLEKIDVFIIKIFISNQALGTYSTAFRIVTPLAFLPFAITYSLYPILSLNENKIDINKYFQYGLEIIYYIGLIVLVSGVFWGKEIYHILYGNTYNEGKTVFQLLLISQFSSFFCFYLIDYSNSQKNQKISLYSIIATLIILLPIQFITIKKYLLIGAGISKILLFTINLIVLIFLLSKKIATEQYNKLLKMSLKLILISFLAIFVIQFSINIIIKTILFAIFLFALSRKEFIRNIVSNLKYITI